MSADTTLEKRPTFVRQNEVLTARLRAARATKNGRYPPGFFTGDSLRALDEFGETIAARKKTKIKTGELPDGSTVIMRSEAGVPVVTLEER